MQVDKLHEWISTCALMNYKIREDLHHHIKEDQYGREYSKVIDFYTDIMVYEYYNHNEEYFNSDEFYLHCEVLLLDDSLIKNQIYNMWEQE